MLVRYGSLVFRACRLLLAVWFVVSLWPDVAQARISGGGGDSESTEVSPVSVAADGTIEVPPFFVRAGHGGPIIHSAPSDSAPSLSGLFLDTSLEVTGERVDGNGVLWYTTRLWGVFPGWVRADQTDVGASPEASSDESALPTPTVAAAASAVSPLLPLKATGQLVDEYILRDGPGTDAEVIDTFPAGTRVAVVGWETDSDASAWF
ncbi:MAG TPA: SH3 domain-containing protein, partial [Chloroflexota bacterium]|nr:SH3 domain-containing protein [Chloroflexota bacterium]